MSYVRKIDVWFNEEIFPYERQYTMLALRLTKCSDEALDLVHDAYTQIFALDNWAHITNPKAYMMRSVYNIGLNHIKRSQIVSIKQIADYDAIDDIDLAPDAFDTYSDRQELKIVLDALAQLPPQCRKVLVMRRIEGVAPRDVAKKLGLSLSTVEKHLARGLLLLSEYLVGESQKLPDSKKIPQNNAFRFHDSRNNLLRPHDKKSEN